jgi:hypothetical protein
MTNDDRTVHCGCENLPRDTMIPALCVWSRSALITDTSVLGPLGIGKSAFAQQVSASEPPTPIPPPWRPWEPVTPGTSAGRDRARMGETS